MRFRRVGSRFLLRGEIGDRFPAALVALAREQEWLSGSISGLGGVRNVKLAYFDVLRKEYLPIQVDGVVELVSLTGNLTIVDGEPFWHLHAVVSDAAGSVTAGHLASLEVAVTLECWIDIVGERVERWRDEVSGLNLLDVH